LVLHTPAPFDLTIVLYATKILSSNATISNVTTPGRSSFIGIKNFGSSVESVGKKRDEMMVSPNINRYWGEKRTS
jgi:hypothetical protein